MNINVTKNLIKALGWTYAGLPADEDLFICKFTLGNYSMSIYTLTNRVLITNTVTSAVVKDVFVIEDILINTIIKDMINLNIYLPAPVAPPQ